MKSTIYTRIKDLRKQHGYTQTYVAKWLHISQNAYSELESGKTKIDVDRLQQIAGLYKIPASVLLEEKTVPVVVKIKK